MTTLRRLIGSATTIGFAAVYCCLVAPPAMANITGEALNIVAVTAAGDEASIQVALPHGVSSWVWSSTQPMELRSPKSGALIAVLNPDGRESRVEYIDDPVVNMSFSVQSGPVEVAFFISSALLSFSPLTAEGRSSAGFSLTDGDGNGATLTGIGDPAGAQGAYLAQYNGFAATISGTTFAELVPAMSAGAFATSVQSGEVPVGPGFTNIGTPVSDMSVFISFKLSANDLASGTSTYVMQPRPVPTQASTWSRIKSLYE